MAVLDVTGLNNITVTARLEEAAGQVEAAGAAGGGARKFGLVVDGPTLQLIMPVPENRELLYQVPP